MINGHALKNIVESHGLAHTCELLESELAAGNLKPEDFSLRELAEEFCGREWVRRLNPRNTERFVNMDLQEAGEGVDVTAFGHITGQIVFSKIQQGWDQVGMIGDELFENVPTIYDGEKIPGVGRLTSQGNSIRPGMPYPEQGFGEQYWETPSTTKHGLITSVTKEAIFFDHTALVTRRAGEVGKFLRYNKEQRQLAVFAGITVTIGNESFVGNNTHKWNGTIYANYQTGANAIGINSLASTPLVDWNTINTVRQLFVKLIDPDSGLPINIMPNTLVTMPVNEWLADRIMTATKVTAVTPGYATSGNPSLTESKNPVPKYKLLSSPLLRQLMVNSGLTGTQTDAYNWLGDPKRAFSYMENWPLTTVQAPTNSTAEFERDIVLRWKSSERGTPWCADPRYVAQFYNT